jgi:hypothetical protein
MFAEWAGSVAVVTFLNGGSAITRHDTSTYQTTTEKSLAVFGSTRSNQWMNGNLRVK